MPADALSFFTCQIFAHGRYLISVFQSPSKIDPHRNTGLFYPQANLIQIRTPATSFHLDPHYIHLRASSAFHSQGQFDPRRTRSIRLGLGLHNEELLFAHIKNLKVALWKCDNTGSRFLHTLARVEEYRELKCSNRKVAIGFEYIINNRCICDYRPALLRI